MTIGGPSGIGGPGGPTGATAPAAIDGPDAADPATDVAQVTASGTSAATSIDDLAAALDAGTISPQQALVSAHFLGGIRRKASREDRQALKQQLFRRAQQLIAPVDGRFEAVVPGRSRPGDGREHGESLIETRE